MPHAAEKWTAAEVQALPYDGKRYEVVDGELLVTPAPAPIHQCMVGLVYALLLTWLREHRLGEAFMSPADIELDHGTLVQPDVFVVPLIDGRGPARWTDVRDLLLAVEIISPPSVRADRVIKRRRYQRAGIGEYWIVDLDARLVERWRPTDERPEVLTDRIEWRPAEAAPGLVIDLTELFEEAVGR